MADSIDKLLNIIDDRCEKNINKKSANYIKQRIGKVIEYDSDNRKAYVAFPEDEKEQIHTYYNKTAEYLEEGNQVKIFYTTNIDKGWIGLKLGDPQIITYSGGGVGKASDWDSTSEYFNSYTGDYKNIAGTDGDTEYYAHAEGYGTKALGRYSHAEGWSTTADGYSSHAEGSSTTATGFGAHAEGMGSRALGQASHTEGSGYTSESGMFAHAEGMSTSATNCAAHAEGTDTEASGAYAHAEGNHTKATGVYSHSEGDNTTASGDKSHAEGQRTTASAWQAHAEGYNTVASKVCAHAEGSDTEASGSCAHAEGSYTAATGELSHAEGDHTKATQDSCHAEGYYSTASGASSHAEGDHTTASGINSHAEGSYTTASGTNSHAEGEYTTVSGSDSHAGGNHSVVEDSASFAHGRYLELSNSQRTSGRAAFGQYNDDSNINLIFQIGNGEVVNGEVKRSNAFAVDNEGYIYCKGIYNSEGSNTVKSYDGAKETSTVVVSVDNTNNTIAASVNISKDNDNALSVGEDGGLYAKKNVVNTYATGIKFTATGFDLTFSDGEKSYVNSFVVSEDANGNITKISNNSTGRSIDVSYD